MGQRFIKKQRVLEFNVQKITQLDSDLLVYISQAAVKYSSDGWNTNSPVDNMSPANTVLPVLTWPMEHNYDCSRDFLIPGF